MQKTQTFGKILDAIKRFFKTRGVGFYLAAAAVVLALIQLIVYAVAFSDMLYIQYLSPAAIACSSVAIVLGIGLSCTKWTEKWAPAAIALFELLAFLFFIKDGYWYFTTQFYAGVTMKAIATTYYAYLFSIIVFVIILGLSIASMYLRQTRKTAEKTESANETGEVTV